VRYRPVRNIDNIHERAYAWSHATEGTRRRLHAVLGLPPADGPIMAVKTAVMAEYRTQNWEARPARRWR
jgi:hypothetical protein